MASNLEISLSWNPGRICLRRPYAPLILSALFLSLALAASRLLWRTWRGGIRGRRPEGEGEVEGEGGEREEGW